jgi:hypothetical protein
MKWNLFTFVNAGVLGWLLQGYPEHRGATMAGTCIPLKGSGTALKAIRARQQNCQNHCVFGEPCKPPLNDLKIFLHCTIKCARFRA